MTSSSGQDHSILKHLFAACKDDENGYRSAVKHVKAEALQAMLHGYADQRAKYAAALQSALEERGGHSESSGTIAGALHLGWATIKAAATGGDDNALLAECVRAEEVARDRYEKALTEPLAPDVRELVGRQLRGIQAACEHLRALQAAASSPRPQHD
jgi:uncharacterized protein (TIGR02284 family)